MRTRQPGVVPFSACAATLLLIAILAAGAAPPPAPPAPAPPSPAPASPAPVCDGEWASLASGAHPLKVWARCSGSYAADLGKALALLDAHWSRFEPFMGGPKPDQGGVHGGGDPAIDVYLVARGSGAAPGGDTCRAAGDVVRHDWGCYTLAGQGAAEAYTAALVPEGLRGNSSSGFILLDRAALGTPEMKLDAAHELFHVFQYAHNRKVASGNPVFWFAEASANWAAHYANRGGGAALGELHAMFVDFQSDASPLDTSDGTHPYLAWIWGAFMEQEAGAPAIGAAWSGMAGCADAECFAKAVDAALPFETKFRDFAVRNLNENLGEPLAVRYRALESTFPDGRKPRYEVEGSLSPIERGQDPERRPVSVPHLRAQYFRYKVSGQVGEVRIDLTDVGPEGRADIDVLEKIGGAWKRRSVGATKLRWCRDEAEQKLDEVIVVVSNHDRAADAQVEGTLAASAFREACKPAWRGTIRHAFHESTVLDKKSQGGGEETTAQGRTERHAEYTIHVDETSRARLLLTRSGDNTNKHTYTVNDHGKECKITQVMRSEYSDSVADEVEATVDGRGLDRALDDDVTEVFLTYSTGTSRWTTTTKIYMESTDCEGKVKSSDTTQAVDNDTTAAAPLIRAQVNPKDRAHLVGTHTTKRGDATITVSWDLRRE